MVSVHGCSGVFRRLCEGLRLLRVGNAMGYTYLTTPVSTLTPCSSRFDELQEHLGHIRNMHPGVDIRSRAVIERSTRLDARRQERRVENAVNTTRPGTPAMYDRRAHDRGLDPSLSPGRLDEQLGVAVHRRLRDGPDRVDVVDVRPYLWVQLAEVFILHDDARAAEVDVEGGQRGGRARAHACEEGAYCGVVVGVAVVFWVVLVNLLTLLLSLCCMAWAAWASECGTTYGLRCLPLTRHP